HRACPDPAPKLSKSGTPPSTTTSIINRHPPHVPQRQSVPSFPRRRRSRLFTMALAPALVPPADFKALSEGMARDLESHTLPQAPLIIRIPLLGLSEKELNRVVVHRLVNFQYALGRKLEWKERDRLASHVVTHSSGPCWGFLAFGVGTFAVHAGLTERYKPRTFLPRLKWFSLSVVAGILAEGLVNGMSKWRLASKVNRDPDLQQFRKEMAANLLQILEARRKAYSTRRPPLPFPSSQRPPHDAAASRPEDDDQHSWPQTVQDQDPFGNHPPQPPPTQDPTWQDDPLNEVEGSAPTPAPGSGPSPWDRLRADKAAPGQPTTTTPQQTWAERRRAALEKNISDKGGDPAASYAVHDEEGARAQTQAQREFDEMLERERRAAQDNGNGGGRGSAGGKRW
ncbi:hypothetical protein B0T18DRAFT_175875, partial [Schizothecium vesticola]